MSLTAAYELDTEGLQSKTDSKLAEQMLAVIATVERLQKQVTFLTE